MTELIPNTVEDDCVHKTSSFKLETANVIVSISFLLVKFYDSGSVEETEQFTTWMVIYCTVSWQFHLSNIPIPPTVYPYC